MANSNQKIDKPVNWAADLHYVSGKSSYGITEMLQGGWINKWSKDKPYRGTNLFRKSRTVHNAAEETGVYLGSRGAETGYPVYWGLKYPMNTAQQNGSGVGRQTLLELCYDVSVRQGIGELPNRTHPNYTFVPPVKGIDPFRSGDMDGYNGKCGAFLDARLVGANIVPNAPSEITVNRFITPNLRFVAQIPMDATGWEFKDICPEPHNYRFVVEFYTNNADTWKHKSTALPFKTVASAKSLNISDRYIEIEVPLTDILTSAQLTQTTSFYACIGFNRVSSVAANGTITWAGSAAFVAPWQSGANFCATKVTVESVSPYNVSFQQYNANQGSAYYDFPTSNTKITNPTLRFKGTIANNGTSKLTIWSINNGATGLIFRARAYGAYGQYRVYNGSHTGNGGNDNQGASRVMKVAENANLSNNASYIEIAANGSKTVYFEAEDLIPYGYTTEIVMEVSNDGGNSWVITGTHQCNLYRIP